MASLALSCSGGGSTKPEATLTATPRPLPSPVAFVPEPFPGFMLGDPTFEALPGARAYHGRLGGSVYQMEIPDDWNGRLVLYLHGSRDQFPTLSVDQPAIREYLILNGFAWGASSFSRNDAALFLGADETAALWNLFVQRFGRPTYTYVTGQSMGGGGTTISVERFPDRFDGGLGLCGIVGSATLQDYFGDFFVAGAFVAGVTQEEFTSTPAAELIDGRIRPALLDPSARQRFEDVIIDLTGGPRPFDREGLALEEAPLWTRIPGLLQVGLYDNRETVYRLRPGTGVSSEEFNAAAIRVSPAPLRDLLRAISETTGDIKRPLLTMHTTGDFNVPLLHQQLLRERVEQAEKGDLLVQRTVREARHCAFTTDEWAAGVEDLIAWVERGEKPQGEDLLAEDLSDVGVPH